MDIGDVRSTAYEFIDIVDRLSNRTRGKGVSPRQNVIRMGRYAVAGQTGLLPIDRIETSIEDESGDETIEGFGPQLTYELIMSYDEMDQATIDYSGDYGFAVTLGDSGPLIGDKGEAYADKLITDLKKMIADKTIILIPVEYF
jgi:hypothetical protein